MKSISPVHSLSNRSFLIVCMTWAIFLGLLVRLPFFMGTNFPIGDGGFFALMTDELLANGYILPSHIDWNGSRLPWAYPPLGIYLTVLTRDLFNLETLTVLRILPLIFNLLTIAVFVRLAWSLLGERVPVLFASSIFPLMTRSYRWMILGGGATRSPAFLFTLCTILFFHEYLKSNNKKQSWLAIAFLTLTALTHLEWTATAIIAMCALVLFSKPDRVGLSSLLYTLGSGFVLSSLWWGPRLYELGVEPFLAAAGTSEFHLQPFLFKFQNSSIRLFKVGTAIRLDPLVIFSIVGFFIVCAKREFFLPIFMILSKLFTPRHAATPICVSVAMLSAVGLHGIGQGLLGCIRKFGFPCFRTSRFVFWLGRPFLGVSNGIGIVTLLLSITLLFTIHKYDIERPLYTIKQTQRDGLAWVSENTPLNSRFIYLGFQYGSINDYVADWFHYLAKRPSLTTVQGQEWQPQEYHNRFKTAKVIRRLLRQSPTTLVTFIESKYKNFDGVVISHPQGKQALKGFLSSGRYTLLYENSDIIILKVGR